MQVEDFLPGRAACGSNIRSRVNNEYCNFQKITGSFVSAVKLVNFQIICHFTSFYNYLWSSHHLLQCYILSLLCIALWHFYGCKILHFFSALHFFG